MDHTIWSVIANSDSSLSLLCKGVAIDCTSNLPLSSVYNREKLALSGDAFFLISYNEKVFAPTLPKVYLELQRTKVYWLNWADKTIAYQKYNKEIVRSAITLKLLSYERSGAVLAAVTASLPETIGEVRNWDYRFCWIRGRFNSRSDE